MFIAIPITLIKCPYFWGSMMAHTGLGVFVYDHEGSLSIIVIPVINCYRPPVRAVCLNHEVVVFKPRVGNAPHLGSVANYTSYSNPPDPRASTDFLFLFFPPSILSSPYQ